MRHLHPISRALAPVLCCLWSAGAVAQTIYRCGSSYSQTPCAGAVSIVVDDSRTAQQKSQTDAATLQARQLANQMERERMAQEKAAMAARPRQDIGNTNANANGKGKRKSMRTAQVAAASDAANANRKPRPHPNNKHGTELEFFTAPAAAEKKPMPGTGKSPGR